jgi:hypothetical protein
MDQEDFDAIQKEYPMSLHLKLMHRLRSLLPEEAPTDVVMFIVGKLVKEKATLLIDTKRKIIAVLCDDESIEITQGDTD